MPTKGSWESVEAAMEDASGGTFLRLENDGDKAVVAFCGPPYVRVLAWDEKAKTYSAWDDAAKTSGLKKQTRYSINTFVVTLKGKPLDEMRVYDMTYPTATGVIALRDKYGFGKCLFEIARHGAKGDTKTTYNILPDADITAAQAALFGTPVPGDRNGWNEGTVPLRDLEEATSKDSAGGADTAVTDDLKKAGDKKADKKVAAAATSANGHAAPAAVPTPAANPSPGAQGSAAPTPTAPQTGVVSKEVANALIEKLKPLDRDKGIAPFLARFPYAKRVSELLASDTAAAIAYANQLAAPPAAEDPFA